MRRILSMVLVLLVVLGANVYGQQVFFDVDFDDEPLGTMMVIEGVRGIKHDAPEMWRPLGVRVRVYICGEYPMAMAMISTTNWPSR